MFKHFALLLLLVPLCVLSGRAQTFDAKKLDSLFTELDSNNEAMGSAAVFKCGKLLYEKAIGHSYISDNDKLPATTATRYRAASITKMYTATLIFQLIDEHKLSLGATIDKWFPEIPNANIISIRQLLCHRSGLRNFITSTTWVMRAKTEQELLDLIAKSKPAFSPDSTAEYSNTNYWLLGFIAERICNKTYSALLQERIATPLHLTDTYYGGITDTGKNESYSYRFIDDKWKQYQETDMSWLGGAGAVVATPADICRFMTGLFTGKLISVESLAEMTTTTETEGMGILKVPFYTHKGYGHTGHIDGFYSTTCYFPADSLAVVYCSNGHRYPINDILIGILSVCYGTPYSIPDFKAIKANAGNMAKYTGTYACDKFPLKIVVTIEAEGLTAQATGQQSFPLNSIATDKFNFAPADIEMDFLTDKNQMVFKQHRHTYVFVKEGK